MGSNLGILPESSQVNEGHFTQLVSEMPAGMAYQWLSRLVIPRPIALVSSLSAEGQANLAPFSFFMLGGSNPPSVVFCPTLDITGNPKDTLRNIQDTEEFVINLVDRTMADGLNVTSFPYPPEIDEWPLAGFTRAASRLVRPERVAESKVQLECKLFEIVAHGTGPSSSAYVIGEVVAIHIDSSIMKDDLLHDFHPIARLGGRAYLDLNGGKVFEMTRPNERPAPSEDL